MAVEIETKEIVPPIVPHKTLWGIMKGTLLGVDKEGSAKRITSMFFTIIILLSLFITYERGFIIAVRNATPNDVDVLVVKMMPELVFSVEITIALLLGLTTVEVITNLVKTIKGSNEKPV